MQFNYHSPKSETELAALLNGMEDYCLLAGGTDVMVKMKEKLISPRNLVDVSGIESLKGIRETADSLWIGPLVTHRELMDSPVMNTKTAALCLAASEVGSPQIRNAGTLGGNIGNASPIGDSPPLLIALGAQLLLRKGQSHRTLAIEDYFIDYRVTARQEGEFIEKIIIPRADTSQTFRAYKISKRLDDDISAVCAAFNLQIDNGVVTGARVAFGGMAAIAKRAGACEAALLGADLNSASIERACSALATDFTPLSDFRASKEYRLLSAQNLLRKYFIELQTPHLETRVTAYV